jgi:hypothetical protein
MGIACRQTVTNSLREFENNPRMAMPGLASPLLIIKPSYHRAFSGERVMGLKMAAACLSAVFNRWPPHLRLENHFGEFSIHRCGAIR